MLISERGNLSVRITSSNVCRIRKLASLERLQKNQEKTRQLLLQLQLGGQGANRSVLLLCFLSELAKVAVE